MINDPSQVEKYNELKQKHDAAVTYMEYLIKTIPELGEDSIGLKNHFQVQLYRLEKTVPELGERLKLFGMGIYDDGNADL